ncbi:hypothetical protein YEEN111655_09885 [Yersinia entomophaga]
MHTAYFANRRPLSQPVWLENHTINPIREIRNILRTVAHIAYRRQNPKRDKE